LITSIRSATLIAENRQMNQHDDDYDVADLNDLRDSLQELLDRGIITVDGPLDDLDTVVSLTTPTDVVH
jgi:hypothetical protein